MKNLEAKCGVLNTDTGEHQTFPPGYTSIKGKPFSFIWRLRLAIIRAWVKAGSYFI